MEFPRSKKVNELVNAMGNHMIKVITGIRRCGKSYLLNTLFRKYLLSIGIKEDHIIYFSFDNNEDILKLEKYYPEEELNKKVKGSKDSFVVNSKKFLEYIKEATNKKGTYYILLDEVQYLESFYLTLNSLLYHENYDVFVTGSNSKFLSTDIATEFRGRGWVIDMQPLSYKEIYDEYKKDSRTLLDKYLKFGGLPLCVLAKTDEDKSKYLINAYKTIYSRDVLEKGKIQYEEECKELIEVVSSSVGSYTNVDNIVKTFKSKEKSNISNHTAKKYLSLLEDAFIITKAQRYDIKGRKYISSPIKYYFGDLGIRNAVIGFRQFERNHLMENLIYNELKNRGFTVNVGSVSKYELNSSGTYSSRNYEIDFIAEKGQKKYYIQSAYSIEDDEKREQETKPLKLVDNSFKKLIIVYDSNGYNYDFDGHLILSLEEFLLNEDSIDY